MVNCCDDYGNCRQGRDCPLRHAAAAATEIGADDPAPAPRPPTSLLAVATLIVVLIVAGILAY